MKTTHQDAGHTIVVNTPLPQPLDCPLLTFETAGAYLGITAVAVTALVKGTHKGDKELADVLRDGLVVLSPHRRRIRKDAVLGYLNRKIAEAEKAAQSSGIAS